MKRKVAVIGAGTAGLIAARELGRLGIPTIVYDQKRVLGFPVRASGILSVTGLGMLGIGYKKAVTNTLYGANVYSGSAVMRIRAEKPQAYVLDRLELNELCRQDAVAQGAEVVTGKKIGAAELDALHNDNIIVGADGAVSTVARHFGLGEQGRHVLTYKAEYESSALNGVVELFFDGSYAQNFFAWLCPNTKDVVEVGIGVDPGYGNSRKAFDTFLKSKRVKEALDGARQVGEPKASIIPLQLRKNMVDNNKEVLLVGDAAGQVKPSTGGGIVFGGSGAILAAKWIDWHMRSGESLDGYAGEFRKRYVPDLRLHGVINRLYSNPKRLARVMKLMSAFGVEGFLGKYGDMDRPTVMLKRVVSRKSA